jgi:Na+-transporting methylmalonyl-CoA/oxaloacetate decarboxylase gamma subunit
MNKDTILIGLIVLVVLILLFRTVSGFASTTFSPDMPEDQAAAIFAKATEDINNELQTRLEEATNKGDLATAKKIGDEGHNAMVKLQDDYHAYLKSKGKAIQQP